PFALFLGSADRLERNLEILITERDFLLRVKLWIGTDIQVSDKVVREMERRGFHAESARYSFFDLTTITHATARRAPRTFEFGRTRRHCARHGGFDLDRFINFTLLYQPRLVWIVVSHMNNDVRSIATQEFMHTRKPSFGSQGKVTAEIRFLA